MKLFGLLSGHYVEIRKKFNIYKNFIQDQKVNWKQAQEEYTWVDSTECMIQFLNVKLDTCNKGLL